MNKQPDKHNQKKIRSPKLKEIKCRVCKNRRGIIRKYGLRMCRRCFKDNALQMGFQKFD